MSLHLSLYPLSCPQYFALQIETSALLRIVQVEQPLESLRDSLYFNVSHLSGAHVQDLAGFVHGDVRRREGATAASTTLAGGCIFLRRGGLTIRFGDGATYYSSAGEDDLCYYAVGLYVLVADGVTRVGTYHCKRCRGKESLCNLLFQSYSMREPRLSVLGGWVLLAMRASPKILGRLPRSRPASVHGT